MDQRKHIKKSQWRHRVARQQQRLSELARTHVTAALSQLKQLVSYPDDWFALLLAGLPSELQTAWEGDPVGAVWSARQQQTQERENQRRLEQQTSERFRTQTWIPGVLAWRESVAEADTPTQAQMQRLLAPTSRTPMTPGSLARALAHVEAERQQWWRQWQQRDISPTAEEMWHALRGLDLHLKTPPSVPRMARMLTSRMGRTYAAWRSELQSLEEALRTRRSNARALAQTARALQQAQHAKAMAERNTWIAVPEIAQRLGVSPSTVRAHIHKQELPVAGTYVSRSYGRHTVGTLHTPDAVEALRLKRLEQGRKSSTQPISAISSQTMRHRRLAQALPGRLRGSHWTVPLPGVAWGPRPVQAHVSIPEVSRTLLEHEGDASASGEPALNLRIVERVKQWETLLNQRVAEWTDGFEPDDRKALIEKLQDTLARETPDLTPPLLTDEPITRTPWDYVLSQCYARFLTHCNPHERKLWSTLELAPADDWFHRPRSRRWSLWLGPTNSGKTHAAMELLQSATHGIYLAPLRLMALEAFDRMTERGISCALVTGEERRTPTQGPETHISATIEAGLMERPWQVAVIDEAQMLQDPERGWAWTQALMGVDAEHLCICAAPEAEGALLALAQRLNEPVTIHRLERFTPLEVSRSVGLG